MKTLRRSGLLIVIVVAALMAAPLFGMGAPALAQCSQSGSTVDCTGTDTDGFQTSGTVQVTVQAGATVNNSANTTVDTISVGANSTVTNDGSVAATGTGSAGVYALSNGTIDNNGTITTTGDTTGTNYASGVYVVNSGTVINDGTISTSGSGAHGVASLGAGNNITNNGTITTTGSGSDGIQVNTTGGVNITNTGTITGANDGIETRRATTTVNNSGTITGTENGIRTSVVADSNDTIVNSGTITGGNGTAIDTRGGDDSVELTGSAPVVNGLIDGGAGTDTLIFSFDVLSTDYAAVSADIAAASPAGGSLSYNGQTYSWVNFEQLINLLNQVAAGGGGGGGGSTGGSTVVTITIGGIGDGRLNGMDMAATAIVYCSSGGTGLDLYAVTGGGVEFAFNADQAAIEAALAAAGGSAVQVVPALAGESYGVSLFATDSTHLQVFGPGGYTYGFEANVCGLG